MKMSSIVRSILLLIVIDVNIYLKYNTEYFEKKYGDYKDVD